MLETRKVDDNKICRPFRKPTSLRPRYVTGTRYSENIPEVQAGRS